MSARCKLCNLPTADSAIDLCPQCIADRAPSGPPWPPSVDPAGQASAAARAVAALRAINDDPEGSHRRADVALLRFLHEAGFGIVADVYAEAEERTSRGGEWWYA